MKTLKNKFGLKNDRLNIILLLVLFVSTSVFAQNNTKTNDTMVRPFQLSIITPLGTNGMESQNITNNFSINLFAGYSGGLDGVEFSGFSSVIKNDMKGARFSGFSNVTLGSTEGVDFAGFVNFSKNQTKGAQFAGFTNLITDDAIGTQVSGFANVCNGRLQGAQIAGFTNHSNGNSKIFQASGFANTSNGTIEGAQIAGFSNINRGGKNAQIAGFCNVASDNIKGAQIAGFSNIGAQEVNGFQLSGFFNYAEKLNGIQIAPFNYVDSLEKGTPIGVFSIVKNGYQAIGINANESFYFNIDLKTGTQAFYTYLTSGLGTRHNMLLWHWGFGVGTMMPITENYMLDFNVQSSHVNEDEWFTNNLNLHNKLSATCSYKLTDNIALIGGLSWNVIVSDAYDNYGRTWESSAAPYTLFNKTYSNTNIKMYPGINIGLVFN